MKTRYVAKPGEFVTEDYRMFSGQGEAVSNKYHKYLGKSGNTWLVADNDHAAENVYVTANPKNIKGNGFGGATLKMPLVEGGEFLLNGGWNGNSEALFEDTGIDVRNQCRTFVVLSKEMVYTDDDTYRTILRDIVYMDKEPTLGLFSRNKELIKKFPEAKYCYMQSRGGSCCGAIHASEC